MALSMSVSAGAHNARHNTDLAYRANLRNVDADLSVGNISIRDVPIAEAYETVFGDSLREYNAKQKSKGHPERCIGDYLSKIEKAYSDDSARVKSGNKGRVNVPKLDRDIEGKERTVARLDRSIETKTKRLASELDGRFY